jgi:8-oxo-dGTP pyrophosphatase MutT (NUDIX family)
MKTEYSHRVAANAYLLFDNHFLLLKRNTEPLCWAPPGGRLKRDEDPVKGLIREIKEETGIVARVHFPVTTWYGFLHGGLLFSVDYLCTCQQKTVKLSDEHEKYAWLTIKDLQDNHINYFSFSQGFRLTDFEKAWKMYKLFIN